MWDCYVGNIIVEFNETNVFSSIIFKVIIFLFLVDMKYFFSVQRSFESIST